MDIQMTASILDLLEKLNSERTPGDWIISKYSAADKYIEISKPAVLVDYDDVNHREQACNAQFIAASANHLPSVVKGMRIAIKALEAECCCTGEHKYEGSHELIKCDACEALSEIQKLVGGG